MLRDFQTSDRDGNWEIYGMNADGSNVRRLTDNEETDYFPAWSPDGASLAFSTRRDGNMEIYLMDAGGSNLLDLTNHEAVDIMPNWSPDGTQLAFRSDRDGNQEIYMMDADGGNSALICWRPTAFS